MAVFCKGGVPSAGFIEIRAMSKETYWLSRIQPHPDIGWKQLARLGGLNPYSQHQALCKLFDLPPKELRRDQPAPFLYRVEERDGLPLFYMLSADAPKDSSSLWLIESKGFAPMLEEGDVLEFKLRANAVILSKRDRDPSEVEEWARQRNKNRLKVKEVTRKRLRHDVVMEAKRRMGWKEMLPENRPSLADVAYNAGAAWISARQKRFGFKVHDDCLKVYGHRTWRIWKRKSERMALSTLDFDGVLTVTDPVRFLTDTLLRGIGPAKAFGCGLMLVRRI